MPLLPQPLFLLHGDAAFRARVQRAVPDEMHLVEVPGWHALRAAVLTAPPGSLAVVDPYGDDPSGGPSQDVNALLRNFPRLVVVAASRFPSEQYADALTLGTWGVADLVRIGRDGRGTSLRARLHARRSDYFARVRDAILPPGLPSLHQARISSALRVAAAKGGAEEWAAELGLPPRTLLRSCRSAGLPAPRRLLAWMRVLLAADLLESPGHSLASAAVACGYAADMPLRRAIRLLTGTEAPALIAAGDVLAAVAARFATELAEHRGAPQER